MSGERSFQPAGMHGSGELKVLVLPRGNCFERCVEVKREAQAADELRALVARMIDFLPAEHPLVAAARDVLE